MVKYKYMIIDLDGVVWRGSQPINSNIATINKWIKRGINIVFLTNNSTRSRIEYLYKLREYGIEASLDNIVTSGYIAANYIREKGGERVFVIGEAGLYYELSIAGLLPVTIGSKADYVVVGLDRFLTYDKIKHAVKLLRNGAKLVATNMDNVYPVEDGEDPGGGSIVSMISSASNVEPEAVTGKPNPYVLDFIFNKYGFERESTLIIGDRMDMDIYMGYQRDVDTLYVLTGIGKLSDLAKYRFKPKYIAEDLAEFDEKYMR